MPEDIDSIGVKEIGRFSSFVKAAVDDVSSRKTSIQALHSELSIELDGISELTRIDPNKFLKAVQGSVSDYAEIVKLYRAKVFIMGNNELTNDVVDSIVEVMVSLNLLKDAVFRAGGYGNALEYAAGKYGVSVDSLEVSVKEGELEVVRVVSKEDIDEASRIVTSFYGPKVAQDIYSLFVISRFGRLIGVKDGFGKLLGVIQVLFDRWGTSYIHAYCVRKSFRGTGVASVLLDAAEANAKGGFVWVTRALDMTYNIQSLMQKGYVGKAFIPDYWGVGMPRLVFEKRLDGPILHGPSDYDALPVVTSFNPALKAFKVSALDHALLSEALNLRGCEVVGLLAAEASSGKGSGTFVLVSGGGESVFKSRKRGITPPARGDIPYKPVILQSLDDVYEVIRLEEEANSEPREIFGTLRMLTFSELVIGLRDSSGRLVAFTVLGWDGEGGLFCHGLTSLREPGIGAVMGLIEYVIHLAFIWGLGRVSFIHSIEDLEVVENAVNARGFVGLEEFLNPYNNGQNYLLLERRLGPAVARDVASPAPFASKVRDLGPDAGRVLVSVRDYGLTTAALGKGYRVLAVLDGASLKAPKPGKRFFLLVR